MIRMKSPRYRRRVTIAATACLLLLVVSFSVGAEDAPATGSFLGSDLLTEDVEKAAAFYSDLFGWDVKKVKDGGFSAHHQGRLIASFSQIDEPGASFWMVGVAVPDVARAVKTAATLGTRVHEPVTTVEGYGRFAVISDPQGATIMLIEPGEKPIGRTSGPGSWRWAELWTDDVEGAQAFYSEVIGYTHATVERGGGPYRTFVSAGENRAGLVEIPDELESVRPGWVPYVGVAELEAAMTDVERLKGRVIFATQEKKTEAKVALILDPVGAALFIYEIGTHKAVTP